MDIQQTVDLTYVKVDEIDRKLNNMEFGGTEGSSTDSKLNNLQTICENTATKQDLTTKINLVKGEDDIDLTQINEKLTSLASFLGKNPYPEDFTADPYKLDEDFTGYTAGETTFNTTDSVECTKQYSINTQTGNTTLELCYIPIYCESETFDVKVKIDCETNTNFTLFATFLNNTIGTTNLKQQSITGVSGRQTLEFNIEDVNSSSEGNYFYLKFQSVPATIYYYKIEVVGTNVKILSKAPKYKVFCKFDETIISKVENYNGYSLTLNANKLNPSDLKKDFTLQCQDIRDFTEILTPYKYNSYVGKGFHIKSMVTLAGQPEHQTTDATPHITTYFGNVKRCYLIDNSHYSEFAMMFMLTSANSNYHRLHYYTTYPYTSIRDSSCYYSTGKIADLCIIQDITNNLRTINPLSIIQTNSTGENIFYLNLQSTSWSFNLGFGFNTTAYYDKDDKNIIYVYMKVGDKMVKKTFKISYITNEEDSSVTYLGEIINQKVIGTYDYYFETQSDVYLVVKNNTLYMFK